MFSSTLDGDSGFDETKNYEAPSSNVPKAGLCGDITLRVLRKGNSNEPEVRPSHPSGHRQDDKSLFRVKGQAST